MLQCRVCGRDFDPLRFQVVVPGLGQGFDRVECAEQARALLGPSTAPIPVPAVVRPFPAPSPALAAVPALASLAEARRPLLVGANLALLAAGTAATVYLWFRVFGADPTALQIPGPGGESAFERGTVPAEISMRERPRESPRRSAPEPTIVSSGPSTAPPAPAPAGGAGPTTSPLPTPVSGPVRSGGEGEGAGAGAGGGSALGPGEPTTRPRPPAPAPTGGGQRHGKSGTAPHGKAKGHDKPHGPVANHDKPHSAGQGKKVGHDKHH